MVVRIQCCGPGEIPNGFLAILSYFDDLKKSWFYQHFSFLLDVISYLVFLSMY